MFTLLASRLYWQLVVSRLRPTYSEKFVRLFFSGTWFSDTGNKITKPLEILLIPLQSSSAIFHCILPLHCSNELNYLQLQLPLHLHIHIHIHFCHVPPWRSSSSATALTSPILDSATSPVDCLEWSPHVRTNNLCNSKVC